MKILFLIEVIVPRGFAKYSSAILNDVIWKKYMTQNHRNVEELGKMFHFIIIRVSDGGLAPLGITPAAGTVMKNSRI